MIRVNSVIKLNMPKISQLTKAKVTALEQTADALLTDVRSAQVFPRDTGNLQGESTFVDNSQEWKSQHRIQYTLCQKALLPSGVPFPDRGKPQCKG